MLLRWSLKNRLTADKHCRATGWQDLPCRAGYWAYATRMAGYIAKARSWHIPDYYRGGTHGDNSRSAGDTCGKHARHCFVSYSSRRQITDEDIGLAGDDGKWYRRMRYRGWHGAWRVNGCVTMRGILQHQIRYASSWFSHGN